MEEITCSLATTHLPPYLPVRGRAGCNGELSLRSTPRVHEVPAPHVGQARNMSIGQGGSPPGIGKYLALLRNIQNTEKTVCIKPLKRP